MFRRRKTILMATIAAIAVIGIFTAIYITMTGSGKGFLAKKESSESTKQTASIDTTAADSTTQVSSQAPETTMENTKEQEQGDQAQNGNSKERGYVKVKAVYLSGTVAGSPKLLDHFIDLVKKTELNALVIDIKEAGYVNYKSSIPMVKDNGLCKNYYNPTEMLKKLHDNGVYVIGRLVTFRDPGLASKRADLAIKKPDGSLWREGKLGPWTNPYLEEVWKYNIEIAKEAINLGFDEIQFDYVRFPTTTKSNRADYGPNPPPKDQTISSFLSMAKKELHDGMGVNVSADVFGIICESVSDGKAIGQDLEIVGKDIDAISPMVYPSHYAVGQIVNGVKFDKPDFKPYEVVYNTLLKCKNRLSKVEGYNSKVRPYLQDFTASYLKEGLYQNYGAAQVRQQIKAVYDAGYDEWILWDGRNTYTEAALLPESK